MSRARHGGFGELVTPASAREGMQNQLRDNMARAMRLRCVSLVPE
jgi:hypothetical protein